MPARPRTQGPRREPPHTLFFLNSPSMPLVRPDTAVSFCFMMAPKSYFRSVNTMPAAAKWFLASAYMWLLWRRAWGVGGAEEGRQRMHAGGVACICKQPPIDTGRCMHVLPLRVRASHACRRDAHGVPLLNKMPAEPSASRCMHAVFGWTPQPPTAGVGTHTQGCPHELASRLYGQRSDCMALMPLPMQFHARVKGLHTLLLGAPIHIHRALSRKWFGRG